ncbi:hypothetical protein ACFXGT_27875 [Streptomyces sp. NPDC059352]|uniref:hypothetical protein n=1 Tax=Streptomyces sp. NPDC059352 TaxID=3346810 RepID=UPI0036CCDCDA
MVNTGRLLAALAVSCLTVTGCANQDGPPQSTGVTLELTHDPAYYEGREIRLPLDSYALTRTQRDDFYEAVYAISSECMKEFGLEWPKPAQGKSPATDNSRRYGVIDLPQAKKFGYGVPLPDGMTHEEALKIGHENIERTRRLSQGARNVYTGEGAKTFDGKAVPHGGCRGRAYANLGLPPEGMISTTLDAMRYEAWDRARNSRIVIDAVARWSTCMDKAGYAYKTLEEAVGDPSWRRQGDPSEEEISAATTDITCKREVMLVEKWHAVEMENQKLLMREREDVLGELKRELRSLVNNIIRVRSGS